MDYPKILITREAVLEMYAEVMEHRTIETAWGVYGLISIDRSTVIVTGVLRPSEADVVRQFATTQLGGESQADAMRWLVANVELMKKQGLTNLDNFQFTFLFKGHSHHGLQFDSYSSTDNRSILEAVKTDGLSIAIGPLAIIERDSIQIKQRTRQSGTLSIDTSIKVKLRFYVMTKEMVDADITLPVLIKPEIVDAASIPIMPPLGWQFVREEDFVEQIRLLQSYGCQVSCLFREINNGPPYEVQFIVTKPIWKGMLSIITAWDYPQTVPIFQVLNPTADPSRAQLNFSIDADELSRDLWKVGSDLIEGVFRLEARGQL